MVSRRLHRGCLRLFGRVHVQHGAHDAEGVLAGVGTHVPRARGYPHAIGQARALPGPAHARGQGRYQALAEATREGDALAG